ncbi:hypothetical protein [Fodinicola feengrottensis]|uniref:hypothetical protein n=1 Tax=Fodinicola feengrottensis TaxID=435914 RepID=UPI002441A998|nr:hypothetical protein [Fodinicola feengrottensis]
MLSAAVVGVLVVAVRPYLRLIGGSLAGSTALAVAFAIVSLFARNGNPRLGLLQFGLVDSESAPSYFSALFIEAAVAAMVPAAIVAWVGRRRGGTSRGVRRRWPAPLDRFCSGCPTCSPATGPLTRSTRPGRGSMCRRRRCWLSFWWRRWWPG